MNPFSPFKISAKARHFLQEALSLLLPFCFWLFLYQDFFSKHLGLGGTAPVYYLRIKYFLDSMATGVYPLWNPFVAWGSPDLLDMRVLGEFNPFLYLILFFKSFGIPDYSSYLLYLVTYYFVGLAGFYLLARHLCKNRIIAWIAYALLLFSSLSPTLFSENVLAYMFVPGIWFFLFLILFREHPQKLYLLGMTFCLMLLLTTYIPFHFCTIFCCLLIAFIFVYSQQLRNFLSRAVPALIKWKWWTILCALSVGCSLVPGWVWHQAANNGQYTINFRHAGAPDKDFLSMPFDFVNQSGIASMSWQDLFSGLKFTAGLSTIFFYLPYFLYLIIMLSLINRVNKKLLLLFASGFLTFIIILTSVTPLYKFLYDHVFFFRTFRNLFFLLYLSMPIIILYAAEQLRLIFAWRTATFKRKILLTSWILLCHALFIAFLCSQTAVLETAYVTTACSLFFFLGILWLEKKQPAKTVLVFFLGLSLFAEPAQLFGQIFHDWKTFKGYSSYPAEEWQRPSFSFTRPIKETDQLVDQKYGYAGIKKSMQDTSGFIDNEYIGTTRSFFLQNNMNPKVLQEYVQNKFYVYDSVQKLNEANLDLKQIETAWANKSNIAFVFNDAALTTPFASITPSEHQNLAITDNSSQFQVIGFGLNFIKFRTNFSATKFLVYNDSYYPGWHAFVNGKLTTIWQANIAFKGLWLGPGENIVFLRYGSLWLYYFNLFLSGYFFLIFLCLIMFFIRTRKHPCA